MKPVGAWSALASDLCAFEERGAHVGRQLHGHLPAQAVPRHGQMLGALGTEGTQLLSPQPATSSAGNAIQVWHQSKGLCHIHLFQRTDDFQKDLEQSAVHLNTLAHDVYAA